MSRAFDVLSEHRPNLIVAWDQKTISCLTRCLVEASCLEPNLVLSEFKMFVIPKEILCLLYGLIESIIHLKKSKNPS